MTSESFGVSNAGKLLGMTKLQLARQQRGSQRLEQLKKTDI
jgi:hypothetical protein